MNAPRPAAAAMNPTPAGPTLNTSSASAGNSDRGDPNTIALRSTMKVASTSRRLRANRSPSMTARDARARARRAQAGSARISSSATIAART